MRSISLLVCGWLLSSACGGETPRLRVLRNEWPRVWFFRNAEGFASNSKISYERWDAAFSRLMGIQGKVLDEEIPGRSKRNIPFFTRFKKAHPDQLVLLHYNGNARDPRDLTKEFFAGHFIYHVGARIAADVPAEDGETDIQVDNPRFFRTDMGRYGGKNEDIGLCMLDDKGRPNWHESEQVELVSVDTAKKTIRVRRGRFGTKPRAFPAGKAYAAAHATEGPWGRRNNLMWFYNYSTACPRDAKGRQCADVLVPEIVSWFAEDGKLAVFDGIEFDVLHHHTRGQGWRPVDCDADGKGDNGVIDGVNTYGNGVVAFCRALREKLPRDFPILADGMSVHNQRAFGILNGIESEGWPLHMDYKVEDWSGGLNRHFFWQANAREPKLNYINHKYIMRAGPLPGDKKRPDVPWSTHRLVFAVACFTDSAITYAYVPPKRKGELIGVWDELWMGQEKRLGWLGKPLEPPRRLAKNQPGRALLPEHGVTLSDPGARGIVYRFGPVPCDGSDLTVFVRASAKPMRGHDPAIARMMWVGIPRPQARLTAPQMPTTGMRLRGGKDVEIDKATGASVRRIAQCTLGGETKPAYMAHPPYKGAKGLTYWERTVTVPKQGRLEFCTGMGEKSPQKSDGVVFRLLVDGEKVFEHTQTASKWLPHTVPLTKWTGKKVTLRFVSDCGPKDNAVTDHSHWGDAWVLGPKGREGITPAVRYMTWVNGGAFESSFAFTGIRSDSVGLEITIEGGEPVRIESVRAHAHPDAISRLYENGLVLANPSPRPFVFDLGKLYPDRTFRRLRGTELQDTKTNDGSRVGAKVTLPPKDALFLVLRGE